MVDLNKITTLIKNDERTLYAIAKDAGVDYALVHRLVNGKVKKDVWMGTAFKLADALGVDVNEFRSEKSD